MKIYGNRNIITASEIQQFNTTLLTPFRLYAILKLRNSNQTHVEAWQGQFYIKAGAVSDQNKFTAHALQPSSGYSLVIHVQIWVTLHENMNHIICCVFCTCAFTAIETVREALARSVARRGQGAWSTSPQPGKIPKF